MRNKFDPDVLSIALAEPSRRALLENLRFGPKTVSELVQATQLKQPNVSNHLAKMRLQGIVRAERMGRQVYYSLSMPFADVLMRMHEYVSNSVANGVAGSPPAAESSGSHPIAADVQAAPMNNDHRGSVEHSGPDDARPPLMEWRNTYFQSIFGGKEDQATHLVNAMLSQGLDMATIYTEVFQWAINRIGDLFQQGATDEAHEHMASAITERMMARVAQFHNPVTRSQYRAVLGSVAGNWHVMGLRMLADGLRALGWDTVFLGANVPTASFASMVQLMRPDLIVISCAMEDQALELRELIACLRAQPAQAEKPFVIAVGGQYVMSHANLLADLHADFSAPDLPHFLAEIRARYTLHSKN
jgi:MerR family transcriptional regulator, light-induced transcriptional regulator